MVDPLALWGAVTGSLGTGLGVRREYLASRRRLAVAPGCNLNISRDDDPRVTHAWAFVAVWNTGGRALAVEHVGFRYVVADPPTDKAQKVWEYRAEIGIGDAVELSVDSATRKFHTPLAPMLAAGVDPVSPIEAFAVTTGDQWWYSPPQRLISQPPPGLDVERFAQSLGDLRDAAEVPPQPTGWCS
jgi:hypothetical protein